MVGCCRCIGDITWAGGYPVKIARIVGLSLDAKPVDLDVVLYATVAKCMLGSTGWHSVSQVAKLLCLPSQLS